MRFALLAALIFGLVVLAASDSIELEARKKGSGIDAEGKYTHDITDNVSLDLGLKHSHGGGKTDTSVGLGTTIKF